jgi:DNA topoisomerase-1
LVAELQAHRDELDPKHRYLLDAPAADPAGRPAVIRYNRKSLVHYVQSELEGKASGWKAVHEDGVWRVEDSAAAAQKKAAKKPATSAASAKGTSKKTSKKPAAPDASGKAEKKGSVK